MKIRKWDSVTVTSGKDSWKQWEILKCFPASHKVIVKDINIVTRHVKKQWTQAGQIMKFEKAVDVSNVMIICPITEKPTRIGFTFVEEKWKTKKYRYSKRAVKETGKTPKDCLIK